MEKLLMVNAVLGVAVLVLIVLIELDKRIREKKVALARAVRKRELNDELVAKQRDWEVYKNYIESVEICEGYTYDGEYVIGTLQDLIAREDVEDGTVDVLHEGIDIKEVEDTSSTYVPTGDKLDNFSCFSHHSNRSEQFRDVMQGYTVSEVLKAFY